MTLALFDFDGTITRRDTFLDFLVFCFGYLRVAAVLIRLSPWIFLYAVGRIRNDDLKQRVLKAFFCGMPIADVRRMGEAFARDVLPERTKPSAMERLAWHREQAHRVVLVSASLDVWLEPWCKTHSIELVSSRLEVLDDRTTGRLEGLNCYGAEKVRRIRERIDLSTCEMIYAYGDSRGDREMLAISGRPHYRFFRR